MKDILLLCLNLALTGTLHAQVNCSHKGSSMPDWLRSTSENVRSDTMDVLHFDVSLNFRDFLNQQVSGSCEVHFTPKMAGVDGISLDLLTLTVDSVLDKNGGHLNFSYNDTLIRVNFPSPFSISDTSSVNVFYRGTPGQDPTGWGGFYFQGNYAYNIGVGFSVDPHTFGRAWHPCFDNFAERATYTFQIITRNSETAYCNGVLTSRSTVGADSVLHVWEMTDPIPSYLSSVAVSAYTHVNWQHVSALTGDTIPVWLIAQPGDTSNMKSSFANIGAGIDGFESMFGVHQYDKVGFVLVPFNAGAMEHATNIAYPRSVANGSTLFQSLMAHELSHHWWGDYVTTESAAEMWINEGMARYCEALFFENLNGYEAYMDNIRGNHYDVLRFAHLADSGHYPLNAVPHNYTYGDHSYNKGADMLHTIRGYMGDSLFFTGLRSVQQTFGERTMNSYEFRDALASSSGLDLTDCFDDWVFSTGQPAFAIDSVVYSGTPPALTAQIFVKQQLRARTNLAQNVPLTVTFVHQDWNTVHEEEIVMSGALNSFMVTLPFTPQIVVLNRNDRISHAVTAQEEVVTSTALANFTQAMMTVSPQNQVDSSLIRVEHHWVAPDPFLNQPSDLVISRQRYWVFDGIIAPGAVFNGRIDFNGTTTSSAGWLDDLLMQDTPLQPFHEDSLVLLYRTQTGEEWVEFPTYSVNPMGSPTNKMGQINIQNLQKGQYTLGYRTNSVSITERQKEQSTLLVFPNPASGEIFIKNMDGYREVNVFNMAGSLVATYYPQGATGINVSSLKNGTYTLRAIDGKGHVLAGKLQILR